MLVLKTPDDYGQPVEITDIGGVGPYGRDPMPLTQITDRGHFRDPSNPEKPLTGAQLKKAVSEHFDGLPLEVANVKSDEVSEPGEAQAQISGQEAVGERPAQPGPTQEPPKADPRQAGAPSDITDNKEKGA